MNDKSNIKTKRVRKSIISTKAKVWFVINMVCSVMYLMWRTFFTIPIGYGTVSVVAGVTLLIVEALGLIEALVHYINMYNTEDYPKPDVPLELFPDVDIFVATYNEEPELLKKTLLGCKRMEYPDPDKVHIYLCDDGKRQCMRELAKELQIHYLDREDHKGQKAGNLNNALKHSSSPYVVTFDSDMIPQSCFLMETIPYFVDAEMRNKGKAESEQIRLGFLQTPQSFYDLDLFQFNLHSESKIPNEQDYFYRDIEVARTRTNSCIYGGSNTVLSRRALEDIGGFYTEAITEDFATGILIQKAGYVSLGISKRLASGVSAKKLQELIQQRVRWARGVISTGKKMHIYTSKDLSFGQKINYWASIWYWYAPIKRLCYILSPILYGAFGFMVFRCTIWQVLLFWLPMYVSSTVSLRLLSNNIRNTKWTAIYEYALFPYMLLPVILETFGFSLKKFKVTKKSGISNERRNFLYMTPLIILIALSIIGIVRCIAVVFVSGSLGPIVVLFWLIYNMYAMIMCLFFVDGRNVYRGAERVYVELESWLIVDDKRYPVITKDISETGIALYLDKPILINNNENRMAAVEVVDGKRKARFNVLTKHTKEIKQGKWLYTFSIEDIDDVNYDNLLAVLYDRVPVNPSEIKRNNGVYDDLLTNIYHRVTSQSSLKRHYPRINIGRYIPAMIDGEAGVIKVKNFNYQYFATETLADTKEENGEVVAKEVEFIVGKFKIKTRYEETVNKMHLYRVLDFEKIYFEERNRDAIMEAILKIVRDSKDRGGDNNTEKNIGYKDMTTFSEMSIV